MGPYSSRKCPYKETKRHQNCLSVCAQRRGSVRTGQRSLVGYSPVHGAAEELAMT